MAAYLNGDEVERRKTARRVLEYPIRIGLPDGSETRGQILNISNSGAGLSLANEEALPGEFDILLSFYNGGKRPCRKVWQSERQVGVEFLKSIEN